MRKSILLVLVLVVALIGSGTALYFTINSVKSTQSALAASQNTVLSQNQDLAGRDIIIQDLQNQLDEKSKELSDTQTTLSDTQAALTATKDSLNQLSSEKSQADILLQSYQDGFKNTKLQLETVQNQVLLYQDTYGDISIGEVPLGRISDGNIMNLGRSFRLQRNPLAVNLTWEQLLTFLKNDHTDENPYVDGLYTCGNYAEDIFNHAESSGINAAVVCVFFKDDAMGHALNAFKTTDRGLVFIDCSGEPSGYHNPRMITQVDLEIGKPYLRKFIFNSYGSYFYPYGEVETISFYW